MVLQQYLFYYYSIVKVLKMKYNFRYDFTKETHFHKIL